VASVMEGDENSVPVERLVAIVEGIDKRLDGVSDKVDTLSPQVVSGEAVRVKDKQMKSLLIVDEKYLTETLKIIFQIIGYQVDTAHNGIQALKKTLDKPYDLVIMEANLSDASGFEMAQIIKNMSRKTKMVLMTGDEYWEEAQRGVPMGVDDVLLKPFAPEELVNAVRKILEPRLEARDGKTPKLPFA